MSRLLKLSYKKDYGSVKNFNGDSHRFIADSYFVNLNVVNVNKKGTTGSEAKKKGGEQNYFEEYTNPTGGRQYENAFLRTTVVRLNGRDGKAVGNKKNAVALTNHKSILNRTVKRALVYGSPGAGKTTLCHKIVHDFYERKLWSSHFDEIVWLQLRRFNNFEFSEDNDLNEEKLLKKYFNRKDLDLNLDKVLFLLDGWDEIQDLLSKPNKSKVAEIIEQLGARANVIVTSRPFVELNFQEYDRVFEIIGFNGSNVREYIHAAFQNKTSFDLVEEDEERILEYYTGNTTLSDLFGIPLLLEMFLHTWREIKTVVALEMEKVTVTKLYEIIVEKMSKNILTTGNAEESFRETVKQSGTNVFKIIFQMANKWLQDGTLQFSCTEFNCTDEEKLALQKLPFLTKIQENSREENRCEFVHLTFLEFFAALQLINRDDEEDFRRFIVENKFHPRFFVVLTFVAGLINSDLHNLFQSHEIKEITEESTVRFSSQEKLEFFFDYLEEDPIDLSGKYYYALIMGCIKECDLSETRVGVICHDMLTAGLQTDYTDGIYGGSILTDLKHIPRPLLNEVLESDESILNNCLVNGVKRISQMTDDQINKLVCKDKVKNSAKLHILCQQQSHSPLCVQKIVKLMDYDFVSNSGLVTTNLNADILERFWKMIRIHNMINGDDRDRNFHLNLKGISAHNGKLLCQKMCSSVQPNDSLKEIVIKLILSPTVCTESLCILKNIYEFRPVFPQAISDVLSKHEANDTIYERTIEISAYLKVDSRIVAQRFLQTCKDEAVSSRMKYNVVRALSKIYLAREIQPEVTTDLFNVFKRAFQHEKERVSIKNKFFGNYVKVKIEKKDYFNTSLNIRQSKMTIKSFLDTIMYKLSSVCRSMFMEIMLQEEDGCLLTQESMADVTETMNKEEKSLLEMGKFIAKHRTLSGDLNLCDSITDFFKAKDTSIGAPFDIFHLDLIRESIQCLIEILMSDYENDGVNNEDWRWSFRRILQILFEIRRIESGNHTSVTDNKKINENCMDHENLLNLKYLKLMLGEGEEARIYDNNEQLECRRQNLTRALQYFSYKRRRYEAALWETLEGCDFEDSQYQDDVVSYLVQQFVEGMELELKEIVLANLIKRINFLTKEQLRKILQADFADFAMAEADCENNDSNAKCKQKQRSKLQSKRNFCKDVLKLKIFSDDEILNFSENGKSLGFFFKQLKTLNEECTLVTLLETYSSQILLDMKHPKFRNIVELISQFLETGYIDYNWLIKIPSALSIKWNTATAKAKMYIPENLTTAFVVAYCMCKAVDDLDFLTFGGTFHKLTVATSNELKISNEDLPGLFKKLDDEILGMYYLNVIEDSCIRIPMIIDFLKDSSCSATQKALGTYLLAQKINLYHDHRAMFLYNNGFYFGTSAHDAPLRADLNENQLQCLMNVKAKHRKVGMNVRMHGIARRVHDFRVSLEKCSVVDLTEREEFLKEKNHLDMSGENICQRQEIQKICKFIQRYPVETLVLSDNKITTELTEFLLENISKTNLQHLMLDNNLIDLTEINVNKFFGDGSKSSIRNCKMLKLLDLSQNTISDIGSQVLEQLEDVQLSYRKNTMGKVVLRIMRIKFCTVLYMRDNDPLATQSSCNII